MPDTSVNLSDNPTLCEVLDRILHKGAVIAGDIAISVADIDLIYINLRLMVTSASKMQRDYTDGTGVDKPGADQKSEASLLLKADTP